MQRADIDAWFDAETQGDLDGEYGYLCLRQRALAVWRPLLPQLTTFLERAHADALQHFQELIGASLDPLGAPAVAYPQSLPLKTLKGYFGEAFCGLIAEVIEIVGRKTWSVPVFLFRFHQHAGDYLTRLITGETPNSNIPGRPGSDFVGLVLNQLQDIEAFLVGESKCHARLNVTEAAAALRSLSNGKAVPVGLPQLRSILSEIDSARFAGTIRSIEKIMLEAAVCEIPRTDLLVYVFEHPGVNAYQAPRISVQARTQHYTCGRELQVVEVHVPDATELIQTAYGGLFLASPPHART